MVETLVLIILSMLTGGAITQHDGIKGLTIAIAGVLLFTILWSLFGHL